MITNSNRINNSNERAISSGNYANIFATITISISSCLPPSTHSYANITVLYNDASKP